MRLSQQNRTSASEDAARGVAIMLSLDLTHHPSTQRGMQYLTHLWQLSGQPDKTVQLETGDISELLPLIAQIETEHGAWVAEDPENRSFGPPSPFE
jgi:hypothetical protein